MCINKYELFTIDRIEGDFVVCENRKNGNFVNISLSELPENIHEGDIIKYENGKYTIDTNSTNTVKNNILDRFNRLKK